MCATLVSIHKALHTDCALSVAVADLNSEQMDINIEVDQQYVFKSQVE